MDDYPSSSQPHHRAPVLTAGEPLSSARAAVVLLPGRGAPANSLLPLVEHLMRPGVSFLLPEAEEHAWYPYPFLAPTGQNEPYLSGALAKVAGVLADINQAGIPTERVLVGGFSQSACLALEL